MWETQRSALAPSLRLSQRLALSCWLPEGARLAGTPDGQFLLLLAQLEAPVLSNPGHTLSPTRARCLRARCSPAAAAPCRPPHGAAGPWQPLARRAEDGSAAAARCEGNRTLNSQAGSGATGLPGTALAGSRTSLCSEMWAFRCVSARTWVPKTSDGFIGIGITAGFHAFKRRRLC